MKLAGPVKRRPSESTSQVSAFCLLLFAVVLSGFAPTVAADVPAQPNIVLIFADDLGWGDLSCYGNEDWETPHIDRLAAEGVRLTDFYVSTPSCAPSRAALLTGRFPYRTGLPSNPAPDSGRDHGIIDNVTTLAEFVKQFDFATLCVGKWHLGHLPPYYPTRHGFDNYFGILYSNDMRPVMLCRDEQAVEYPVVQSYLTQRYTQTALDFIAEQGDADPFFLYLPHAMPHKPLAASEEFYSPGTRDDLYGDVIRELDWSVGQIVAAIDERGLAEETLIIFASDNGPWFGGSTGGLRGMKASTWEGGIRVPGIFRWTGTIPAGRVVDTPCATIDVVPTICRLFETDADQYGVDGFDITPLLTGQGEQADRHIFSWNGTNLMTIRDGRWKLHVRRPSARQRGNPDEEWIDPRGPDGVTIIAPPEQYQPWQYPSPPPGEDAAQARAGLLFDLETDPGEQHDVSDAHPEIVQRLQAVADEHQQAALKVPQPEIPRGRTEFYLGPGRITPETSLPIEEALRQTREP